MLDLLNKEMAAMLEPDQILSSGNLTLLLCKRFLLFSLNNMAVDHLSEQQLTTGWPIPGQQKTQSIHRGALANMAAQPMKPPLLNFSR